MNQSFFVDQPNIWKTIKGNDMQDFVEKTYLFNRIGLCSQEQTVENIEGGISLIDEELDEFCTALNSFEGNKEHWLLGSRTDALDALADILVVTLGLGYRAGFSEEDIKGAMDVVSQQNLNKFCKTKKEAEESVSAYEDDERYKNVHHERAGEGRYVIVGTTDEGTRKIRKILKGLHFENPKGKLMELLMKGDK